MAYIIDSLIFMGLLPLLQKIIPYGIYLLIFGTLTAIFYRTVLFWQRDENTAHSGHGSHNPTPAKRRKVTLINFRWKRKTQ
jgi:hypothetical protein